MSDALVYQALKILSDWMVEVSERFDEVVNKTAQHLCNLIHAKPRHHFRRITKPFSRQLLAIL